MCHSFLHSFPGNLTKAGGETQERVKVQQMAEAEGRIAAKQTSGLDLTRPVHSETLLYDGKRFSVIVVQDENPRIEWTRQDERGADHKWLQKLALELLDGSSAFFDFNVLIHRL